jgi:Protein of unknown function (DUF3617)
MGLWESTIVTKMTGLQIPPDVAERLKAMGRPVPGAEPRTIVTQSCLTPEKWQEMFTRSQQQRENCKLTNLKQDSSQMSADMECDPPGGGSAKGHIQINFVSQEKVHGISHIEAVSDRQPQPIVLDTTFDSTFQGSDCKNISPDSPKIVR